jgi:hypothetical protein
VAKQNRFTSARQLTVSRRKVLISAQSALGPAALADALEVADRLWQHHQELVENGQRSNPFVQMGVNEPHLRAALKAKGYL